MGAIPRYAANFFDDRYEAAVAELVRAKIEGKALPKRREVKVSKPDDLLAALRESAKMLKAGEDKPKRAAANANKGTARKPATRAAASKARSSTPAQRKAG